ncbi:hypothetical protein HYPSUDRAFT_404539 [Hypholoma sublateritium FD-334 SS-4]|uniref:DUF6534 domain-containing protein n=1 Tax=Hypholoma sublateritium (strain FD-334 SS-4) TaxID=945553 RepID=A0A0D2LDM2_HYPSF|nr:hypothetical protein HYPSUDRAFT_404539 [Hypholoma sublateritium FD-334 SS-4]
MSRLPPEEAFPLFIHKHPRSQFISGSSSTVPPLSMSDAIPSNIVLLTAPQLLGVMFNWGLWGILTVQVYVYHLFFRDSLRVRTLVYTLYFLECVQTALSSADIIHWFSKGWGHLSFLSDPYVAPIDLPMMAGLIAMIVQLYFTWRIWVLSTSIPLCALIGAVSVAQCAAGFVSGIQALRIGDLTALSSLAAPKIWLAGAALSDTLIAVSMCYFLYRARQRTLLPQTKFILRRVIALTVETNTLSATAAIATLILFICSPKNTLYLCPPSALSKLYSNTLLVIFNGRMILPNDTAKDPSIGLNVMASMANVHTSDHQPRSQDSGIKVQVHHQIVSDAEAEPEWGVPPYK